MTESMPTAEACLPNGQVQQISPLIVNVSPLYEVLVTCALRLSDGDIFGGILKGFLARSKRLLDVLSCRQ